MRSEDVLTAVVDTPAGQYLVQIFPNRQVHLAWREDASGRWDAGHWGVCEGEG
jgi:hypothetical protein